MLNGKVILVTGGTGSFGTKFVEKVLSQFSPQKLIVFSRDELKQSEMKQIFCEEENPSIRFFLGDIRDKERLYRAMDGVDIVVHAAALKQVPATEYNPSEAIKTNIIGMSNLIDSAIDRNVKKVLALSTDKAVNPINLYGATKLCADKLTVAANNYSGVHQTIFSSVRYGNVVGSRGSVVPLFLKKRKYGKLPVTDVQMTRFWITLGQSVDFVLSCLEKMKGGEIFVPKIPSMNIVDVARAIDPDSSIEITGIRPGEKLHETLIPEDEAHRVVAFDDYYVILATLRMDIDEYIKINGGVSCPKGFRYGSDNNENWLTKEELQCMVKELL